MVTGADITAAVGSTKETALRRFGFPFSGKPDQAYKTWRDWKLSSAPRDAGSQIVELGDL